VLARSTASVDRPLVGRSAAAVFGLLVALIASLAIGAAAARASADSQVAEQASATGQSATATASPAPADASAAPTGASSAPAASSAVPPAPEQESGPVAEEPAEPAPPPAETEVPAEETETPATPTPEQPPATTAPAEAEPTDADPVEPEPAQPPSASATAQNQSQTWQAIFQVQQGCRSNCQGTSQSQSANQHAETIQNATAIGGGTGSPSSATALNQSTTGQFIWQVQLGCVAFCYATSQSQTANQWAQTTQNATALADGNAQAHNVGSVMQQVWQLQVGCETECHGTSQTQSSTQGQSTNQSATATSQTWGPSQPTDLNSLLPAWLIALAENLGITIQTVWQYQEAECREYCVGGSQAQEAAQRAVTSQDARAVAGIPPVEPKPPVVETPPAGDPEPTVATAAGVSSGSPETFIERVTATWRRVSADRTGGSHVRSRSSATASSGPGAGAAADTTVESSVRMEAGSSTAKAHTSTSTNTRAGTSSTDSVSVEPPNGLGKPSFGFGTFGWLLIGLLMAFGLAMLRKTHLRRAVV
jgi:hypothetical protein